MQSLHRWTTAALLLFTVACTEATTGPAAPARTPQRLVIQDPGIVRDGDVITLRAEARASDSSVITGVPMHWSSTNPTVASVTPNGVLTAIREGETELVVIAGGLQERRYLAVVLHPATTIELAQTNIEILLGTRGGVTPILRGLDGRRLLNRPITLESSNEAVVRISPAMELIPVAAGTATVTARYGTLAATAQVRVREVAAGVHYAVRDVGGRTLPADVFLEVLSDDGITRVLEVTRLEEGRVVLGDRYDVALQFVHYERVEYNGAVSERVMGRQTVRDFGDVQYDWLTGNAAFRSGLVGGLVHALDAEAQGPRLRFREGGTSTVWSLGLMPQ